MIRQIRAIYENGVFRPLEALPDLPERSAVRLQVQEEPTGSACLSDFRGLWSTEEADEMAALIEAEFEKVDPREW